MPALASLCSAIETAINKGKLTDGARRMLSISKLVRKDWHDKLEAFHTIRELCDFVQSCFFFFLPSRRLHKGVND